MDPRRDAMDDEQFLMDMIASGSAAAAGHADDTGDAANTDIYLNMSGGDEIDQPIADADDQKTNVYILTLIILFICHTFNE
jgi:hypothetical protein